MTIGNGPFVLFKRIPPERYAPYKDRHIPIHARNIACIKKRLKIEKRMIVKEELQKTTELFIRNKKIEAANNNHIRLLNVI